MELKDIKNELEHIKNTFKEFANISRDTAKGKDGIYKTFELGKEHGYLHCAQMLMYIIRKIDEFIVSVDSNNSSKDLLVCPFCGGEARIQLVDDEGNWRDEDYLFNPYSGIGYVIVHDETLAKDECPIATYESDDSPQGIWIYDTEDEAIEAWNRRIDN